MKDRGGQPYLQGVDLAGLERVPRFTHIISPSRQIKKALGMSGRQYKKFYKLQRRLDKARAVVKPKHHDVVNLNPGEQHGSQIQEVQALREAQGAPTDSAQPESGSGASDAGHGSEAAEGGEHSGGV